MEKDAHSPKFENRQSAGLLLAKELKKLHLPHPAVIALPRGGVPVAEPIAHALHTPIDIVVAKKISAPGYPELAIGAIAEDGEPEWLSNKVHAFDLSPEKLQKMAAAVKLSIKKLHATFSTAPSPDLHGKSVILVDDGLATGATLFAAVNYLKQKSPLSITVALPVASHMALEKLKTLVDHVICLKTPRRFSSVSQVYVDFMQVDDQQVIEILNQYRVKPKKLPPIADEIKKASFPLESEEDGEALIKRMAEARVVFLGESSRGTEDFYRIRRLISQRLVQDHGFKFIAVEGDWPDCWHLNDYIQHGKGLSAHQIMQKFDRWPTWMWANTETEKLVDWMSTNGGSFYGLDLYSLFDSIDVVRKFAKENLDPKIADEFLKAYRCFDPFEDDEKAYARSLNQWPSGCQEEVISSLRKLLRTRLEQTTASAPQLFNAQQNAIIAQNAEKYYRALVSGEESWNIRDEHMMDTLDNLLRFHGEGAKAIVWAHNTHIGDYHATDMLKAGYVNLGGLAREKYGLRECYLTGFGTHHGKVLAGKYWGAPAEAMTLKSAKHGSYEDYFHQVCKDMDVTQIYTNLDPVKSPLLTASEGHRAVGVVYQTQYEESGQNYVPTSLANRYDGFIFIDQTKALKTFATTTKEETKTPETWPSGI